MVVCIACDDPVILMQVIMTFLPKMTTQQIVMTPFQSRRAFVEIE